MGLPIDWMNLWKVVNRTKNRYDPTIQIKVDAKIEKISKHIDDLINNINENKTKNHFPSNLLKELENIKTEVKEIRSIVKSSDVKSLDDNDSSIRVGSVISISPHPEVKGFVIGG
jgi:hypothetical protein